MIKNKLFKNTRNTLNIAPSTDGALTMKDIINKSAPLAPGAFKCQQLMC